jgi:hypothetical protein
MFIHHFASMALEVSRRLTGKTHLRHSVLGVGHWDACVNASIHANVFAVAGHRVSSHRVSCVKAGLDRAATWPEQKPLLPIFKANSGISITKLANTAAK